MERDIQHPQFLDVVLRSGNEEYNRGNVLYNQNQLETMYGIRVPETLTPYYDVRIPIPASLTRSNRTSWVLVPVPGPIGNHGKQSDRSILWRAVNMNKSTTPTHTINGFIMYTPISGIYGELMNSNAGRNRMNSDYVIGKMLGRLVVMKYTYRGSKTIMMMDHTRLELPVFTSEPHELWADTVNNTEQLFNKYGIEIKIKEEDIPSDWNIKIPVPYSHLPEKINKDQHNFYFVPYKTKFSDDLFWYILHEKEAADGPKQMINGKFVYNQVVYAQRKAMESPTKEFSHNLSSKCASHTKYLGDVEYLHNDQTTTFLPSFQDWTERLDNVSSVEE